MMATTDNVKPFAARVLVNPDADVLDGELSPLMRDPKFKADWERRRRTKDQAAATYEASIAEFGVRAGWDDQKICNIIIKWRRKHEEPFIADSKHYKEIINKVRAQCEREDRLNAVTPDTMLSREDALHQLSFQLNTEVISIQQFTTDPRTYVWLLDNGQRLEFANSSGFLQQKSLDGALFDKASIVMPAFNGKEWHKLKVLMMRSIEKVESSAESTYLGACSAWLLAYLRGQLRIDPDIEHGQAASLWSLCD